MQYQRYKVEVRPMENNSVRMSGELVSEFQFSNSSHGENFYAAKLKVLRTSGNYDIIPILVSDRIVGIDEKWTGQYVQIAGSIRTHKNPGASHGQRMLINVFVTEFQLIDEPGTLNEVKIIGTIKREPVLRETLGKRYIADVCIDVERKYKKRDCIPAILWGRNARYISCMDVGTSVSAIGRLQSRHYQKAICNGVYGEYDTLEVSVNEFEEVEEN
jgi:hypothetical protein